MHLLSDPGPTLFRRVAAFASTPAIPSQLSGKAPATLQPNDRPPWSDGPPCAASARRKVT